MASSCAPTFDSCVQVVKGGQGRCFEKTTGREREVLEEGGEDSATVGDDYSISFDKMS